jgi:hypothetical protein
MKNIIMKSKRPDWIINPTKKNILWYTGLWIVGTFLIVLATTNFFTETPFIKKNTIMLLLIILPAVSVFQMLRNYFLNKKNNL